MSAGDTEPMDILMVNWNGAFFLQHLLPLTLEFTDPRHRVSIWDNASMDGSQALLRRFTRTYPGRVQVTFSKTNLGHAGGLERLLDATDRRLLIMLDCDAAPLREGWADVLATEVMAGAAGHGIWHEDYLHPACLCTSRDALGELSVQIGPIYSTLEEWTTVVRDVMQDLTFSARRQGRVLGALPDDGDYLFDGFGKTYGAGLIYHHWFGTRVNAHQGLLRTQEGRTQEGLAASLHALDSWLRAQGLWREAPGRGPLQRWLDESRARLGFP